MNEPILTEPAKIGERKTYLKAVIFMAASVLFFTIMVSSIRHVSAETNPFMIVFFRNFFGFLIIGPIVFRTGISMLRTGRLRLYLVRAVFGLLAMFTWFHAVTYTPLAEAVALNFTMPLFVTLVAIAALGEKVGWRRWAATIVGFLGALVVIQPGFETITFGHIELLIASFFMAASVIVIKRLASTEPPVRIVTYMIIIFTPASLFPALVFWEWPTLTTLYWFGVIGISGTLAHLVFTHALKDVEVTSILPLDFMRLPLTAFVAYLAFAEVPDTATWMGGAIIFASTLYIVHRETKLNKAKSQSYTIT